MAISRINIVRVLALLLAVSAVVYARWPRESAASLEARLNAEIPKGSDDRTVEAILNKEFMGFHWNKSNGRYTEIAGNDGHGFLVRTRYFVEIQMGADEKVSWIHVRQIVVEKPEI